MRVYNNLMGNDSKINASEIAYKDSDNNIDTLDNILSNKSYKVQSFSNVSCTKNSTNNLAQLALTKGLWIVIGQFTYDGSNLRYFFNVGSFGLSSYDNNGIVAGNICGIYNVTGESTTATLSLWPSDKNVIVSGSLRAIKYL